jgi:predicted Zn-dependent protease
MRAPFICLSLALLITPLNGLAEKELPTIGNSSSSLVSVEQERQLGQAWLRLMHGSVKTFSQPIIEEYVRHLVYSMAPNSSVQDRDFSIIVINSPMLNAFAVPGSIVGVNTGLFIHAVSEHEFASVIAHELSHLGQRHYARQLELQKKDAPLNLAGFLASIAIMATAGSDAGMAALATTQAMSVSRQLSFSRQNEQEADRLGIEVLYRSGYDPRAMPILFERMYRQNRLQGEKVPEYLSTHPLSDARISDTRSRALHYPSTVYQESLEYHICKHIVYTHLAEQKSRAVTQFESILKLGNSIQIDAAKFGLAYAWLDSEPEQSLALLEALLVTYPMQISIGVTYGQALANVEGAGAGITYLERMLERNPDNYPVSSALADLYLKADRIDAAEDLLKKMTRQLPENVNLWYRLAETHGLAGHIVDLHIARAEYFVRTNAMDPALEQLRLASSKAQAQTLVLARIHQRMEEIQKLKQESPF